MPPPTWTSFISASVVPVVLVSACGFLCTAFYSRLTNIVNRLRTFQRERLHERELLARDQADGHVDPTIIEGRRELLAMLELQSARVTRRAQLMRRALICLLIAIGLFMVCSLSSGLTVLAPQAMFVAMGLFVAGLVCALGGVIFALFELHGALEPIELEVRFVDDWASRRGSSLDRRHDPEVEPRG